MRTRRANFGMITALGVAALSALLAGQTKTDDAMSQEAGNHPAFQVKTAGEGPAIIMIPGLASSGATWDSTVEHLRGRYRCVELTLAGFCER